MIPPAVRQGDIVAVCAPAGPVPEPALRAGLKVLARQYRVRCDDAVLTRTGFLAGDDDRRAAELEAALGDPDVRAVFVARGGYGTMRLLDRLDPSVLRADPKPIVGFSDTTALLCWALVTAGIASVHGPVVTQLGNLPAADQQALFELLADPEAAPELGELARFGAEVAGPTAGRLVGGNLSLLAHLVGTPYYPDLRGAVLLIEDVGERPYAIDRYMTRLYLAGGFAGVAGVLAGDFTRCAETVGSPEPDVWQVLDERLRSFGLPGRRGAPIGHGDRNRAVLFGGRIQL